MTPEVLIAFSSASFLLALAPGPDNLFVLSQSALYGARSGLCVVAGLCLGLVVQTLAAALGLGVIITALPMLFWAVKIIGALYLLYLAFLCLRYLKAGSHAREALSLSAFKLLRRGFIMNITNPKVQIFFLAFFPQFVAKGTTGTALVAQMVVQGLIFMFMTCLVFSLVAFFAGALADKVRSERFMVVLNALSALLFITLAVCTLCL